MASALAASSDLFASTSSGLAGDEAVKISELLNRCDGGEACSRDGGVEEGSSVTALLHVVTGNGGESLEFADSIAAGSCPLLDQRLAFAGQLA